MNSVDFYDKYYTLLEDQKDEKVIFIGLKDGKMYRHINYGAMKLIEVYVPNGDSIDLEDRINVNIQQNHNNYVSLYDEVIYA